VIKSLHCFITALTVHFVGAIEKDMLKAIALEGIKFMVSRCENLRHAIGKVAPPQLTSTTTIALCAAVFDSQSHTSDMHSFVRHVFANFLHSASRRPFVS
jgi:hypothetical protein